MLTTSWCFGEMGRSREMLRGGWTVLLAVAVGLPALATNWACTNGRLVDFPGECRRDDDCQIDWQCIDDLCTTACQDSRDCPIPEYRCDDGYCIGDHAGQCDGAGDCAPIGNICTAGECVCSGAPSCDPGRECVSGGCECPTGQRDCDGECLPGTECCSFLDCDGGEVCNQGTCLCAPSLVRCGDSCIAATSCCKDTDCLIAGQKCTAGSCA